MNALKDKEEYTKPMSYQSNFLRTIAERGFVHQCTDFEALDSLLAAHEKNGTPLATYIGFDCTAPSLHVGSLIQIMILRWLQKCGHKPIVLMGGGTTKVGDPSGKDEARQLLDDATIYRNMEGIKSHFSQFITFGDGATDAVMVNNDDWLSGLEYIKFLREHGNHFSINRMLRNKSVQLRLEREQEMSFLEFNYMIMQAYDFVELAKRHACRLQIGGSDQWGNIVNGVELHRRSHAADGTEAEDIFGLTTPLLTTSSGAKMGKTADGAVWLNAEMFSSYDYWQFWRNVEDADVKRFLLLFTELSIEEIETLTAHQDQRMNEAKKVLATEATRLLHGEEAALAAAETARRTFEEGAAGDALPVHNIAKAELEAGVPFFKLLADSGLAASGKEARRAVEAGAARLNDAQVNDANHKVTLADMNAEGIIKISANKKKHAVIKAT